MARYAFAAVLAACLIAAGHDARAESTSPAVPTPQARPANIDTAFKPFVTPAKPKQETRAKGIPDDYKIAMLIRTSLIALNQANLTGNYSVLRDLGAPSFQSANNPARLGELFANLRMRGINLEPILVVEPKIAEPFINDRGMLRLKGFFPTQPEQVNFELAFQPVDSQWRLFALAVTTSMNAPVATNSASGGPVAQ